MIISVIGLDTYVAEPPILSEMNISASCLLLNNVNFKRKSPQALINQGIVG